ncbi:hypothetical protein [Rhizobium sp. BK377]|uniref:hypothetical protein n=1 Tax=Rhizobium sp. BK377 TaxID=2587058 RepID=UPI001608F811|nr:hypothetical protein [Rhizobium sp. BK377]MBB3461275.1 hypothetical protein [Rhizobium sp. BK377]
MIDNPNEWISAAERIVSRALGFGVATLVITGVLWLAFYYQLIEKTALGGYPYDVTRIVCVLALGLLLVGAVAWIAKILTTILRYPLKAVVAARAEMEEKQRLRQNMSLVPKEAQLLLYAFNQQPDGRFRSPGDIGVFDHLIAARAVVSESEWSSGRTRGEFMQVHIAFRDPEGQRYLKELVDNHYSDISSDPQKVMEELTYIMRR